MVTQHDLRQALANCDSNTLLQRLGTTLKTGKTNTNVADVVIRSGVVIST